MSNVQWAVIEMKGERHVVPYQDGYTFGHVNFSDCWCHPKRDEQDQNIVIHNDVQRDGGAKLIS